jgi:hypothetical protein
MNPLPDFFATPRDLHEPRNGRRSLRYERRSLCKGVPYRCVGDASQERSSDEEKDPVANNLWAMTDDVQASRSRPRRSKEYGPAAVQDQPPDRRRKTAAPGARWNCLDNSLLIGAPLLNCSGQGLSRIAGKIIRQKGDILGHFGTSTPIAVSPTSERDWAVPNFDFRRHGSETGGQSGALEKTRVPIRGTLSASSASALMLRASGQQIVDRPNVRDRSSRSARPQCNRRAEPDWNAPFDRRVGGG